MGALKGKEMDTGGLSVTKEEDGRREVIGEKREGRGDRKRWGRERREEI